MKLPITELWIDPTIQVRLGLNEDAVVEYVELLDTSEPPPVIVFDEANILADGFHRVEAAQRKGRTEIDAERRPGTREDAMAYAVIANAKGRAVRLTRIERNLGIRRLLDLGWTEQRIADDMLIAQTTVSNIAKERALTASLPADLASDPALTPTHRYRLASLPEAQREPVARVVVEERLTEPDTRALIRALPPTAGRDDILGAARRIVRGMAARDPWMLLQRVTAAMADLQDQYPDADDVRGAIPGDEWSAWSAQIADLISYMETVRQVARRVK